MKRCRIFPALLLVCALFYSCQKNEAPTVRSGNEGGQGISGGITPGQSEGRPGYTLRVDTAFYTLENDTGAETDKTKWAASLSLGEKVLVKKPRRATFSGNGKVYDFVEVRLENGNEGLSFASQIAEGGSLAVIIDDKAMLHKSPKPVDVTGDVIPRKTVVACFPETERDGFIEIRAYDAKDAFRQNYVRIASLSSKETDIQSAILLQTALRLKDDSSTKTRREALLEAALLDYPDSVFNADIQAIFNPNTQALVRTEASASPFMLVIDDNVNVRDLPDPVAGKVIGQLNRDTDVTVSEQTTEPSVIEGISARWYHVIAPVDGWVFGAYLLQ